MTATPEQRKAFAQLVRSWSFEQCANALRTIDEVQDRQANWMRELIHLQYPALANAPNPNSAPQTVYLDSAADRQRIDTLEQQLAEVTAALNAARFTPYDQHGPVFQEQGNDYTPVQKFGFAIAVGTFATYATAKFAGPAIIEAFGVFLNYAFYAAASAVGLGVLYFILKPSETAPESVPLDGQQIIINQTVIFNNGKHEQQR